MTQYIIPQSSSHEQRRVFSAINRAITTLGVTPDEFDVAFRCQLLRNCDAVASSAQLHVVKAMMENPVSKPHVQNLEAAQLVLAMEPSLGKFLTPEAQMEVRLQVPPTSAEDAMYLVAIAAEHTASITTSQANALNLEIGRFQDLPVSMLNEEQKKIISRFEKTAQGQVGANEAMPKKDATYTNLLQTIASNGAIVNDQGKYSRWDSIPQFKMETGNTASVIRNALITTVKNLAEEKQLTPDKRPGLDQDCNMINDNIVIMATTQEELRRQGYNSATGTLFHEDAIRPFQISTSSFFQQPPADRLDTLIKQRVAVTDGHKKVEMSYVVSDKLSVRQQRFFGALRKVQEAAQASISDFEFNTRHRLSLLTFNAPAIAAEKLNEAINRDYDSSFTIDTDLDNPNNKYTASRLRAMPVTITAGQKTPLAEVEKDYKALDVVAEIGTTIFRQMGHALPVMTEQKMGAGFIQVGPEIERGIHLMEQKFKTPFRFFNKDRFLLGDFMAGSRQLHELNSNPISCQWKQYRIDMPSEQYFLEAAIVETARRLAIENKFNPRQNERLESAIREMSAAYVEAVMSPEEYAAKQEAAVETERQRALEAQQKADEERVTAAQKAEQLRAQQEVLRQQKLAEEAVKIIPYMFAGTAMSVLAKGDARRELPNKPAERCFALRFRDIVKREIEPIKANLNRNFAPHRQIGDALFLDDRHSVMRIVDTLCGKNQGVGFNDNNRERVARALQDVLTLPADDSPVYKVNQEAQQRLVEALMQAPVLITAAIGTHSQVQEQHSIYTKLFPAERKNEPSENQRARLLHRRGVIAMEALQGAGVQLPPGLLEQFRQKLVPPEPPPEPEVVTPPPAPPLVIPPEVIIPVVAAPLIPVPLIEDEVQPPPEPKAGDVKPDDNQSEVQKDKPASDEQPKGPVSIEELVRRMEDYILDHAERYNFIRMHLRQNGEHMIVITLSDKDGRSAIPLYLDTERTDINEALAVFRRVQGEALAMDGLVNYVEPCNGQHVDPQMYERIPNVTPTHRTQPKHGSYYVQLSFPAGDGRARSDMSINLGLANTTDNLDEANRRAGRVVELIEEQHRIYNAENAGPLLPVTKQNITDYLRNEIERFAGEWVYPESQAIGKDFPPEIKINSATGNSWLHIPPMRQGGMVDNSWVQPIQFVIDGKPLQEGNAEINTHINDPVVARTRAREIVEEIARNLDGVNFAIDPENPNRLRKASSAELAADPTLVDLPRLRRMQGRIRALYEQDIAIIERERTPDGQGNIRFSLEMTRGKKHDVYESMRESGRDHSKIVRHFTVPESQADAIAPFIAAIQQSVSDNLEAAYHPTTRKEDSPDQIEREKPRLRFSPHYARIALEKAIESASKKHSAIQRVQPTRADLAAERDAVRDPDAQQARN